MIICLPKTFPFTYIILLQDYLGLINGVSLENKMTEIKISYTIKMWK